MKIAKIGLVVLSALHLCYSVDIGDAIVQEENFVGADDEDPNVLDLSHMDVDKLISETDDKELDDIFRFATRITVSDIGFKSLKKLCQYNILIDIESQDNIFDCADIKRESRLVKRENDDEDESVGSGDSDVDNEEEHSSADPVVDLESVDASGDSEIEIQETTIVSEGHIDNTSTDTVKEYETVEAQVNLNVDETAKETDPANTDSIPNIEESKNEGTSDTQPETVAVDSTLPDSLPNESVDQPEESNKPITEIPNEIISETGEAPEGTEGLDGNNEDETEAAISEESGITSTSAAEIIAETTGINEETVLKEFLTPIPSHKDALPDEIEKTANDEIPHILSRGPDLIAVPVPVPVQPQETTETSKVTEHPRTESPSKLGDVDSVDGLSKTDRNAPRQSNPNVIDTTDSKEKENIKADTDRKLADQTDQDQQTTTKSGISGLNVFIFFVIAAAIAGAAVFGYKMYKNRQVSYSTVNTGEDFGKELQEVKVKRADDDRNTDSQKNSKEGKPLMFNDLDITEIEEQHPHTPQPTPRTFKVTPSYLDQNEEGGEGNTKKYGQQ